MAFCDLKPVRVLDEALGRTYIVGETFAVYTVGEDTPVVYSWGMIDSAYADSRGIVVTAQEQDWVLPMKLFSASDEYFRCVALIECAQKKHGFTYAHGKRLLPLKNLYAETDAGKDAYSGESEIEENDAAATFVMLMNFKLMKILWLIALLIMLVIFGALHLFIGANRDNLLYFLPISIAGGGIVALIIYMICHAVARSRFRAIQAADPAANEIVTYVVSKAGFAACESCTYGSGGELVPWSVIDYFIESDRMFILYVGKEPAAFIPKRAFEKKYIGGIADIIALNLEQK